MPIQLLGTSGAVADVEGTTYRALESTMRPTDHGSLGAYRIDAGRTDLYVNANQAADSVLFTFWWRDPTRICVVTQVALNGMSGGPIAFTAGTAIFQAYVARQWTTDSTGGTTVLPGNSGVVDQSHQRSTMNSTMLTGIRAASTASLNAGTWVLDAQPIGQCMAAIGTTANTTWLNRTPLYTSTASDGPLVLHQQEGLVLRCTVPATGNWRFGVHVSWYELTAF